MRVSFLNWNLNGKNYRVIYRATPFKKVTPVLNRYLADILCLQEISKSQEITALPFLKTFSVFWSKDNSCGIFSKFPVIGSEELSLPKTIAPYEGQAGITLFTDIKLEENNNLRVYNCHLSIEKIGIATRIKLLEFILTHASVHKGPLVVCGDMNTTIPEQGIGRKIIQWFYQIPSREFFVEGRYYADDERYYFARTARRYGFTEAVDISENTWIPRYQLTPFRIKLDWFLTKGVHSAEATLGPCASDHRPILATCEV